MTASSTVCLPRTAPYIKHDCPRTHAIARTKTSEGSEWIVLRERGKYDPTPWAALNDDVQD